MRPFMAGVTKLFTSGRSGSSIVPFPLTPPTHFSALLFTPGSIIETVCWPCARSTWPSGFIRFCALPRGSYFNCRTGHPSLTSCTDSYIGLTFAIGWGSRSIFSSSNASTGWLPGTPPTTASRCQYRPLAPPCVWPGFRSVLSSSIERELRQSALVASSVPCDSSHGLFRGWPSGRTSSSDECRISEKNYWR